MSNRTNINEPDPTSKGYGRNIKNKANENTPFGEVEPSPRTEFENKRK